MFVIMHTVSLFTSFPMSIMVLDNSLASPTVFMNAPLPQVTSKTILFAHLSRDCNREDLVLKAYKDVFLAQKGSIPDIEVYCLHQDLPTFIQTKVK